VVAALPVKTAFTSGALFGSFTSATGFVARMFSRGFVSTSGGSNTA
jgi:hypothetical protein